MNKQETAEAIKVMQGWLDGGNLQERPLGDMDAVWASYGDNAQPVFMFDRYEYRIKPKPHQGYVRLADLHVETGSCEEHCIYVREIFNEDL